MSWEQLNNADIEIHKLAAQQASGGVRPDLMGAKPLDAIFTKLMENTSVLFYLLPLAKAAGASHDSPGSVEKRATEVQKQSKSSRPSSASNDRQDSWYGKSKGKVKSKGKNKGGGKKGEKGVPQALRGGRLTTNKGHPVCYASAPATILCCGEASLPRNTSSFHIQ